MKLTEVQLRHIQAIKSSMTCQAAYKCEKMGFANYPKCNSLAEVLECLENHARDCPHSLSFGYGWLCRCPLNKYIEKLKP